MSVILERRWAQLAGVALIVLTSLVVLRPFIVPIAWAAVLAYASWPLHVRVDRVMGGRVGLSAAVMTGLMVLVVVVPAVLITTALVFELQNAYEGLRAWLAGGPNALTATLRSIPWVGRRAAGLIEGLVANPAQMQEWVIARTGLLAGLIATTAGDLGRLALDAILTLLTLFFFFRHGGELVPQIHSTARRVAGGSVDPLIHTLGETVRAVMYGTLSTALTQALLVALGAWAIGLGSPALLGAVAGFLALTPIGPNATRPPRTPKNPSRNGIRAPPLKNHDLITLSVMLTTKTPHARNRRPPPIRPCRMSQMLEGT